MVLQSKLVAVAAGNKGLFQGSGEWDTFVVATCRPVCYTSYWHPAIHGKTVATRDQVVNIQSMPRLCIQMSTSLLHTFRKKHKTNGSHFRFALGFAPTTPFYETSTLQQYLLRRNHYLDKPPGPALVGSREGKCRGSYCGSSAG